MSPIGPAHADGRDMLARPCFAGVESRWVGVRIRSAAGVPGLEGAPKPNVAAVNERSYREG